MQKPRKRKIKENIYCFITNKNVLFYVLLTRMMKAEKVKDVKCPGHFIEFHQ